MEPSNEQQASAPKSNKGLIIGGVIILLVIIGGVLFFTTQTSQVSNTTNTQTTVSPTEGSLVSPSAEASGAMMEGEAKTVKVTGSNFKFNPAEIRVKKGDTVKIVFTNSGGTHDFVIDEFNVRTPVIEGGETAEVEFVADKTGTFEYYCSVGQHRQMGMVGNLIVE